MNADDARAISDLLFGESRFDRNRKPNNIEVTTNALLFGSTGDRTGFQCLASFTVEAAKVPKSVCPSSESVSVIASVLSATGVAFPEQFFLAEERERPAFFLNLSERRPRVQTEEDQRVCNLWSWGVSVGLLQLTRWADPHRPMKVFFERFIKNYIPAFADVTTRGIVNEMPNGDLLDGLSAIIADLAKNQPARFQCLVKQLCKMPNVMVSSSEFGRQLFKALRAQYWSTRTEKNQMDMIAND